MKLVREEERADHPSSSDHHKTAGRNLIFKEDEVMVKEYSDGEGIFCM